MAKPTLLFEGLGGFGDTMIKILTVLKVVILLYKTKPQIFIQGPIKSQIKIKFF